MSNKETTTKAERKLQDRLNGLIKILPGSQRLWQLDRLAMELEFYADLLERLVTLKPGEFDPTRFEHSDPAGLRKDALYLRRLQYDLEVARDRGRGMTPTDTTSRFYFPRGRRP